MANLVKTNTYGNVKQIMIGQDSYYIALPVRVSGTANGKLLAGLPINGDITDRDTAFTAGTTTATGILLHEVELDEEGNGNGTLVLAGCVDLLKLDDTVVTAIEGVTSGLERIIFVKGSAI